MACEGSGSAPAAQSPASAQVQSALAQRPEGFRAGLATHKVQLSAEQAKQLEAQGANVRVLGDYGSFKLVQVDDTALSSLPQGAEPRDEYNDILLNAGVVDTASAHGQSLRGMEMQASGKRLHIVQFAGPIKPEWVKELEATGVRLITYIPNNAYIVYGDVASLTALRKHISDARSIQWNANYLDDYKLDPSIQTVPSKTYSIQLIKDAEANGPTLDLIRGKQSRDGTIREALGYVNVVAYLTVKDLYEIAARPDVLSIQPRTEPRKNDERQDIILAGKLTGNGPSGPGYLQWLTDKGFTQAQFTASGFGVDVSDSGFDNGTTAPNHFGFYTGGDINGASRVVYARVEGSSPGTTPGCDGHGNLNAHIIGGFNSKTGAPFQDAQGYSYGLGVAPFVKLGSSVIFGPDYTDPVYEDLQSRAYRDGMRISSNSWGYTSGNTYNVDCQQYDSLVRDAQQSGHAEPNVPGNQEMVIVFAAGNNGSAANTVAPPGTAKNIITVGASENVQAFGGADACAVADTGADSANDIIDFSGRGPSSDGRKKPDIVGPGTHVSGGVAQDASQRAEPPANPNGKALSCFDASGVCAGPNSSNFFPVNQQWYTASSGTSHSTPAVAGGAALVRQYFINQGITPPSPAMTKAYLMNSARYMTGVDANDNLWSNKQGMGMMNLGMAFDGAPRLLDDQNPANLLTATGQTRTFTGVVADTSKPFRVTLAWTDAPGSTTGSAWKNNLDLTVTLGTNTYKGNVFTGANSVTGGTADGSNNVESVFLPAGTTGSFIATVTATNINSDGVPGNASALDQDFSLVAYNTCSAATPAPTGVSAAANGNNRIDVSWTENGASSYAIYRSTTAGGPYTKIGTATSSPYPDNGVSGNTTYYYVVRAMNCAESPDSNEASATAAGSCTLPPTFAGLTSATNGAISTCTNTLSWAAGSPICGGALTYSVYRGTTSGFTPSASNRIATGITGTTFNDDLNLAQGTTYYYVVRATETSTTSTEETNTVQKSASPTGTVTPGVRYFDDLDGNRPANAASYWIATTQSGTTGTMNITTNCHYQSATKAYRFGAANANCGGTYPNSVQATLSLGGNGTTAGINGFALPAGSPNPSMTFNLWYTTENLYDGAWLVYSTTGAAGPWIQVNDSPSTTEPYISAGGYDGVRKNATHRLWTNANAGANGSLKAVTVNISALAGQTVWFGYKFFTDSTTVAEGVYIDDVRITADTVASCSTQVPPPGPAVGYKLTGLPATTQAGVPATVTITALDAVGTPATSYAGTAAFTSSDAQAVLPASVTFTAGVATGSVELRTLGSQTVTVKDTANAALTATGSTSVTPGPATGLAFTTQPVTTKAGVSITPAVKVGLVDQFGNPVTTGTNSVTLAVGNNAGGGTLSGTTTATMVGGVATFSNLSLDKVGTGYTLAASASGLTGATSAAFNILPAAPAKLAYLVQPSTTKAGAPIFPAVKVIILDQFGNTTDAAVDVGVLLTSNPNDARLNGTSTITAINGVATFSDLFLDKTGTYSLDAYADGLNSITSDAFDIIPADPYRVRITRQPSDIVAGGVITPSVQATLYDRFDNVATQATNAVSASIANNPGGGTLSGTLVVNATNGTVDFTNLSVDRAGLNYTLVVGGSGLFPDSSAGFDVGVGAAAQLAFTASPSGNVVSGAPFTVKVAVRDAGGNVVTGATTPVTLALTNAAGATLSGTTTATPVNGVATFTGLSVNKAGAGYQLQASASGLTSATSPAFGVDPGAPASLAFSTQPSNTTAGAAIAPAVRVELKDAQGNTVNTSGASISLALGTNPSGGTLGGTKTTTTLNGVASFGDLSVDKAGTGYTLKASAGALSATSSSFNVAAGAAARLVFRTAPANAAAGATLGSVQVEVQDAQGNVNTGSTALVSLTLGGPAGGTLGGTSSVAAVNGVATFSNLSIQKAGTGYTVTAGSTGLQSATSGAFDIAPAAAAALAFSVQPSNTVAGALIAPAVKVSIQDGFGNLVPSATSSITLALAANPSGGTLSGTATVAAVNGVATFGDLSIGRAGTGYKLTATSGTLTSATSTAFDAQAGSAARLVFTLAPTSTTAGANLGTVSVSIQDAHGNLVNATSSITLSLQGGQGATLSGTTTAAAVNGVATFSGLSIARAGTGYQLTAHANGLTDATSGAFDISHGPAAAAVFTVQPGNTPAGAVISPAVRVTLQDSYGNVATSATTAVTMAIGNNPKNGTLSGTKTVNAINGVATFSDLSIQRNGKGYTLEASAGALPAVTSAAFDITPGKGQKLVFRTTPSQVAAGDSLGSIEVELRDELDNVITEAPTYVTLGLGENPAAAQLLGSMTAATVDGVAKFDGVSLRKAGNGYTLVATAQGFAGATTEAFNVKPGAAASFSLALVASVTAGQEATLSATAYDAYGNPASNYGGSVKVTSSDTAASFASTAQFVEGALPSFKVTFKSSGLRTLTVTDSEKASLSGTVQLNVTPFAQPTVSVTDPAGGTTVSGKVSISVTGAVAQGTTLAQLSILVDGAVVASGTDTTLSGSWDSATVTDETVHTITAVITDGAGNVASSTPVIITVHNGGCGCGATSGTDAGIYLGLLVLARYLLGRRRAKVAA